MVCFSAHWAFGCPKPDLSTKAGRSEYNKANYKKRKEMAETLHGETKRSHTVTSDEGTMTTMPDLKTTHRRSKYEKADYKRRKAVETLHEVSLNAEEAPIKSSVENTADQAVDSSVREVLDRVVGWVVEQEDDLSVQEASGWVVEQAVNPLVQEAAEWVVEQMVEQASESSLTQPSTAEQLIFGISQSVLNHIEELLCVKEQIHGVESGELYRCYLDSEIDSISGASEDTVLVSKEQFVDIHILMREFARGIYDKGKKLIEDSNNDLGEMPVHRYEWALYAMDEANALVEVLDKELTNLTNNQCNNVFTQL
jgi:hypothetical protein